MLEHKHVIIYKDGTVWQSDVDSHAIAKLDSDSDIIAAFTRYNKEYQQVHATERFETWILIWESEKGQDEYQDDDAEYSEWADIWIRRG